MGRYTAPIRQIPEVGFSVESFHHLNQLIRYRDDLQGYVSTEDCIGMRQALVDNPFISTDGPGMESGFHLSEQVALEAGILDGIKKGVSYVIDLIKRVFTRLWDLVSGARFKAQASSVKSKTEEMTEAVDEAQKSAKSDDKPNASVKSFRELTPKPKSNGSEAKIRNNSVTLTVPMSIPKRYTRESYKRLLELTEALVEFYDSPYMHTLAEPKGKIDRLYDQAKTAKGHLDTKAAWAVKNPDQMPYGLSPEISLVNDMVAVHLPTQKEGAHREMSLDISMVKESSKSVSDLAELLERTNSRIPAMRKQRDAALRSLNDQSITSEELDAFKRFASTYMSLTSLITISGTVINQHISVLEDITKAA